MADISVITLPNGTSYNLKDAWARTKIADLEGSLTGGVVPLGTTTTELEDGSTTNPITVNSQSKTATVGNMVYYNNKEFIWDGTKWIELGDLTSMGDLAYKDSATGSVTATGTVSQPSFIGDSMSATGTFTPEGSVSVTKSSVDIVVNNRAGTGQANTYTPEGTVVPDITLSTTTMNSITDVGTLPSCTLPKLTTSVVQENLTLSWADGTFSAGSLPTKGSDTTVATGISEATATFTGTGARLVAESVPNVTGATFTGTEGNVSVSGTPSGTELYLDVNNKYIIERM